MSLSEISNKAQRRLVRRSLATNRDLVLEYQRTYALISLRVDSLVETLSYEKQIGRKITKAEKVRRLSVLREQVAADLGRFTAGAEHAITLGRQQASRLGRQYAAEVQMQLGGVFPFQEKASPFSAGRGDVDRLLREVGKDGAAILREFEEGVLSSKGTPRLLDTADRFRERMSTIPLNRVRTIARTEMVNAYRNASLIALRDAAARGEGSVITGWKWKCRLSIRSCAVCVGMHGRVFPLEVSFATHPNCYCTLLPVLIGQRKTQTGIEWFAKQDEEIQRTILGRGKFELYSEEKLSLEDLIAYDGRNRWEKTLREVRPD